MSQEHIYIPPFCILLMEVHTEIEQVLRPAVFWDCAQHKVVIVFQHFGITGRSHLQGQAVPVEHVLIADSLHVLDVC